MKGIFTRLFGGLKGPFFLFVLAVGLALHIYTQQIINQLRLEARSLVQFYAQMYARAAETESQEGLSFIFEQIILRTNFPLIQTDTLKTPVGWKGISVDANDQSREALQKVQQMVNRMDREIEPVPVKYGDKILNYFYYGDSRLIQQLQWLPYVEVGIIGLFILAGFFGYANIKKSEQRHIWVGMAKETAHQLGTPISSLMGWLEVLGSKKRFDIEKILDEMKNDIQRLQQVTNRFSKIGSKPDLKDTDVVPILKEVMDYMQRRAPQMGRRVVILESFQNVPVVPLNRGLFQWTLENIMKNGLDAMDKEEGRIAVRLFHEVNQNKVVIEIEDNGRGMEKTDMKRIFKPGYTTKSRGWGLGLSLARRIIQEYHGGRLFVKESRVGSGTILRIELRM
jgi:signal transduction histidine kinase